MGFQNTYNTVINFGGKNVYSSSWVSPGSCLTGLTGCFGYGFNTGCCCDSLMIGANPAAFGAGYALGQALPGIISNAIPGIFKGIGNAASFVWNKGLMPAFKGIGKAASFVWNKGLMPAFRGIGNAASWAWGGIKSAASWVGNGIANGAKWLWGGIKSGGKAVGKFFKKLFHKD